MAACQNCGEELPPNVTFCPNCGTNVNAGAQAGPEGGAPTQRVPTPPPPSGMPPQQAAAPPPVPPAQAQGATPPPMQPPAAATMTMPPPPMKPAKKGMSRGLKVGLVIALCVVVLIVVGIVVGVFALVKVVSAPADVANNYVKALNLGNVDEAYSFLSKETQGTETLSGFGEKVAQLKGNISKYNTSSINVESGSPSTATVVMNLSLSDGTKATWDMGLIKENGKWKIQVIEPR